VRRTLVTGADGSIGRAVAARLEGDVLLTDVSTMDVRDAAWVREVVELFEPSVVLHLAAAKHAPEAEIDPVETVEVNVTGTRNVVAAASVVGARVVTVSTCKACDPETVYGASKLIAERLTLNAGGSVARLFNVRESSGNVFELWRAVPDGEPLPVMDAWRYFITLEQAVSLVLRVADMPAGRYMVDPGRPRWMPDVAGETWPGRETVLVSRRRGDRMREPLLARCERAQAVDGGLFHVVGAHDPVMVRV